MWFLLFFLNGILDYQISVKINVFEMLMQYSYLVFLNIYWHSNAEYFRYEIFSDYYAILVNREKRRNATKNCVV